MQAIKERNNQDMQENGKTKKMCPVVTTLKLNNKQEASFHRNPVHLNLLHKDVIYGGDLSL